MFPMQHKIITKTCLYAFDLLKPHFYLVQLEFTGIHIIFLISAQKHTLWVLIRTASPRQSMFWAEIWKISEFFFSENFHFLVVKFSVYMNRLNFVMWTTLWENVPFDNAPSEDSDQTAQMHSLIWIFTGCTCLKVYCLTLQDYYLCTVKFTYKNIHLGKFLKTILINQSPLDTKISSCKSKEIQNQTTYITIHIQYSIGTMRKQGPVVQS